MHPRHDRRLIILELGVVGQILREMPDQACEGGHADKEHHGSRGKQETQEAHQQAHYLNVRSSPQRRQNPTPFKAFSATDRLKASVRSYHTPQLGGVGYADSASPRSIL